MPHLLVTLCDGRTARIPLTEEVEREVRDFLTQSGHYAETWIKIGDDEYVRYSEITRVKISR